jgi:hypothetical protein
MALVLADRVQETTTTTGTGTVTLLGAATGYQSFAAVGNTNTTYYCIQGQTSAEWEVGIGTYTSSGTTLSRDTILSSSNAGAAVNLSAGTKNVFVTYPATRSVYVNGTTITPTNSGILPIASGGTGSSATAYASLTTNVSGILPGANGGTNNGFTQFSGPTTSLKTFSLPDATATILTTNAAVTAAQGGTGQTSYAVGDLLYASTTSALSKLADVATGNALISGGVNTAPLWGQIGLTTHVTGILPAANGGTANGFTQFSGPATSTKTFTLPNATATILTDNAAVTVAQGGTGATSQTAYAVLCGGTTSTGAFQSIAGVGTSGQVLTSNGAGALPTFQAAAGATITGTTTSATYYIVGTTSTSGSLTTASISNTNAISYNANTGALTAVSFSASSDERTKTNWRDVKPDFIENLAKVKHGVFDRIENGNTEVGVSAQSLLNALEQAVIAGEDGKLSVNYGGAALVACIQLSKRVLELEAKLDQLSKGNQ